MLLQKKEFVRALTNLVTDIALKNETSRSLNTKENIRDYFSSECGVDIPSRVGGQAQRREALQASAAPGKKRNSRGSGYSGRGHIPGRVDITERPQIVEDKRRVGDWEADTIVGAGHRGALVSVVDRASKFTVLHPVSSRSAGEVGEAMMERLMPYVEIVHTITSDNGKEFTGHGR